MSETKRPTSDYMESIMFQEFRLLDYGHIVLTDYMGTESSIVESARVSYGGGTKVSRSDIGLLRYLMRHRHTTPFESCEIKVRMKLPIFVARQLIRHRTANVNEYSARYSILDREFYIPEIDQLAPQSTDNRQGRAGELTREQAIAVQQLLLSDAEQQYRHYQVLLNQETDLPYSLKGTGGDRAIDLQADKEFPGIARELARMNLTLNYYSQWIWKIDLHNLMHFLGLRSDHHAQYEIRVYSDKLLEILNGWMPNVWQAFMHYHPNMQAVLLSGPEWECIKHILTSNSSVDALKFALEQAADVSNREIDALMTRLRG